MMRPYLLDTNTASYIIKGNRPTVLTRLAAIPISRIAISVITEAELRFGVTRLPSAKRLRLVVDEFLIRVTIFPWDSNAAREYGSLRASLEKAGETMGNLDMLIAAHALALGATLVTNDRAFSRIKRLRIEDWTT